MAALNQPRKSKLPSLPFFFRTYSENGQGIVYRAERPYGESYMCTGSSQIGNAGGHIIWELGRYADAMPEAAMRQITKPKPMTKAQTNTFVDQNGLGAKYKSMSLYSDDYGYWFTEKSRSRSRSASPKSPKSPKSSKGSKGKSKKNRG